MAPSDSSTRRQTPWLSTTLSSVSGPMVAIRTPSGVGLERNAFLYVGDVLPTGDDASPGDADTARKSADRRPRVGSDRRPNTDPAVVASVGAA